MTLCELEAAPDPIATMPTTSHTQTHNCEQCHRTANVHHTATRGVGANTKYATPPQLCNCLGNDERQVLHELLYAKEHVLVASAAQPAVQLNARCCCIGKGPLCCQSGFAYVERLPCRQPLIVVINLPRQAMIKLGRCSLGP